MIGRAMAALWLVVFVVLAVAGMAPGLAAIVAFYCAGTPFAVCAAIWGDDI